MRNIVLGLGLFVATAASSSEPVIEKVVTQQAGDGTWRFDVTIRHPDTGWDHYADGWRVLHPDGTELGMRVLFHPHVNEQPFTRSLSGVVIPEGLDHVFVQARDLPEGWNAGSVRVDLE